MKLLFENWRQYLTEVSYADAQDILNSKGTLKIIKNYERENPDLRRGGTTTDSREAQYHENFKQWIYFAIPDDITDNQKGTAVLWLRRLAKKFPKLAAGMIKHTKNQTALRGNLETFFHHQRFMSERDLMQVESMIDLFQIVEHAKEDIEAHRQKQTKSPEMVKEGTHFLRGGWYQPTTSLKGGLEQEEELETVPENGWVIMEIHNKAASCFHGTADWCTAQAGLEYFEEYYKPDDPLFIFENKGDRQFLPGDKYQFHYGTEQFMDKNDRPIERALSSLEPESLFGHLHGELMKTEAPKKYPVVQEYHWRAIAEDRRTDPEELAALAENPSMPVRILTKIGKNPSTPLEALEKLAKSDNKFIKRSVQVNSALDMGLAIELYVNNPDDSLIHDRGVDDLLRFLKDGKITAETFQKIFDSVEAKRGHAVRTVPTEVANLERMHEHKIKIRIKR